MSDGVGRLGFLFLDVFLGAFIIAIVLMVTLGKPAAEEDKIGGGSPRFVRVEAAWRPATVEVAPVLIYDGFARDTVGAGGSRNTPAAPIESRGAGHWARFVRESGMVSGGSGVPHSGLYMAGFTLGDAPLMAVGPDARLDTSAARAATVGLAAPDWRFATLWVIDPEPGRWQFALAALETTGLAERHAEDDIHIRVRMFAEGYEKEVEPVDCYQDLSWGDFSRERQVPSRMDDVPVLLIPPPLD